MRLPHLLLMGALAIGAGAASAQVMSQVTSQVTSQVKPVTAPLSPDAVLALRCKAESFARHPAGQMATTIRELQIQRCIKNNGFLDDPR